MKVVRWLRTPGVINAQRLLAWAKLLEDDAPISRKTRAALVRDLRLVAGKRTVSTTSR